MFSCNESLQKRNENISYRYLFSLYSSKGLENFSTFVLTNIIRFKITVINQEKKPPLYQPNWPVENGTFIRKIECWQWELRDDLSEFSNFPSLSWFWFEKGALKRNPFVVFQLFRKSTIDFENEIENNLLMKILHFSY